MKLEELRYYSEKLEQGIDPISGIVFSDDTLLNNELIKEYHKQVRMLIDKMIIIEEDKIFTRIGNSKIPFCLIDNVKNEIELSDTPISISDLCYRINCVVPYGMRKLHAYDVTKKLEDRGFLKTVEWADDKYIKIPTSMGRELGITDVERTNDYGNKYSVNLYTIDAQRFVLFEIL